ncbi:hypothetical protein C0J56_06325 [Pseudomonas fluorescens]|nr:hypothetical protein C0J56_06325 [Pseudomonas fluorescens]
MNTNLVSTADQMWERACSRWSRLGPDSQKKPALPVEGCAGFFVSGSYDFAGITSSTRITPDCG